MTDELRAIQLQQLANIVIDAYLNRGEQFVPEFKPNTKAKLYGSRPKGEDHPKLALNFWYEKADYEPEDRS